MNEPAALPRILLVDGDPHFRAAVGKFLREKRFTVDLAATVPDAVSFLDRSSYDLVLGDILMSDRSGPGLLKTVRDNHPGLDVVFVTASSDIRSAIQAVQMGAYDYIVKPLDFGELLWRIDKALEKARLKKVEREHNKILRKQVLEQGDRLRFLFFGAIETLVNAIEAKDHYTKGHSLRVTRFSVMMARDLGLPFELASNVQLAARLHDVGKLGTSDLILNKPSDLSDEEFALIRNHPESGCEIMGPILEDSVLEIIRHHHESWDGSGYPMGLAGEEIPLGARVVCLADCFDAMTTDRAYKKAMKREDAYREIEKQSGKKFDPNLSGRFIEVIRTHLGPEGP